MRGEEPREGALVMGEPEHLPCPFCGEDFCVDAKEYKHFQYVDGISTLVDTSWAVSCPWCGMRGPGADSEAEAWELWDTGWHGEREDYAEAYRRVGSEVLCERLAREGVIDGGGDD